MAEQQVQVPKPEGQQKRGFGRGAEKRGDKPGDKRPRDGKDRKRGE